MQVQTLGRRRPVIPLTSLVDVVFILLFFFMLASRFASLQAIDLNLAASTERVSAPADTTWFVQIYPDGTLVLNGESTTTETLETRLRSTAGVQLVVQPQPGVSLQAMIGLMDRLRPTGARLSAGATGADG